MLCQVGEALVELGAAPTDLPGDVDYARSSLRTLCWHVEELLVRECSHKAAIGHV